MAAGGARRLTLGGLGEDAVVELVAEVADARPGRRLLAQVAGTGGNPLFVTELVGAPSRREPSRPSTGGPRWRR